MFRLPLNELEEAFRNPRAYRAQLETRASRRFSYSYFNALRDAIHHYHRSGDNAVAARAYLEESLDRFRNNQRSTEVVNRLEWYMKAHYYSGLMTFISRQRVEIPIPEWARESISCSGQVSRIDINPTGGYSVWLLQQGNFEGWKNSLRMPLIQGAVADQLLKVPLQEVHVGVYCFSEQAVQSHQYAAAEVNHAYEKLDQLIHDLDF